MGRINLLRNFIPNYAEIVKGIANMLKKGNEFKWSPVPHDYFSRIKECLVESPMSASPNYSLPLYIFSFASPNTIAMMLLQKNKVSYEHPITFFRQVLRYTELKYNILEK